MKNYIIAIDGPAGSGKSTIAKLIAKKLKFLYIDSGAMYRACTLYFIRKSLLDNSEREIKKHLKNININLLYRKNKSLVFLNGENVTDKIRSIVVSKHVSKVSAINVVRKELVEKQRKYALKSSIVMDGRDIGTTVFSNANLKIYLTASSYVRAQRRKKDLEKINETISIGELIKQIQSRDNYDSSRLISPLCKAQDAVVIDSSSLTIKEVLEKISIFLP